MHPFFSLDVSDIQKLDDRQAREFVALLCKAQLRKKELDDTGVLWGGDQRAADGGFDVYVDLAEGISFSETFPNEKLGIQVKAESFPRSSILKEMSPKGELRSSIGGLAGNRGAYIIVSTKDNCSFSMLREREQAMHQAVEELKCQGNLGLAFIDAKKLVTWAEQHQHIVLWLKETIGTPQKNWRPLGNWSFRESCSEYLFDDLPRIHDSEQKEDISIENGILRIRRILKTRTSAVRLVGLSGVGKTRLLQALFDPRVAPHESALHPDLAVYTDLSHNPTPQPNALAEELVFRGEKTVLVVDNCSSALHEQLCSICFGSNNVSLITIEYDIREDAPEATVFFRLSGSSRELVAEFLQKSKPDLSTEDISTIAQFAGGNYRIASALADTAKKSGEFSTLSNDVLFQRLFHQNHEVDRDLLRDAEALSLVYSFDTNVEDSNSELHRIGQLVGRPVARIYESAIELQRRGLLQRRGTWAAILPQAIANRLAARAIESINPVDLQASFGSNLALRISHSFARRISYLHNSIAASDLVERLMSLTGLLGRYPSLANNGAQIFLLFSAANQKAAIEVVRRFVEEIESDMKPANLSGIAEVERLLGIIAYEPDMFADACNLLLRLKLATKSNSGERPKRRNVLKTLFYPRYSQTNASPTKRRLFIEDLIESKRIDRALVGNELLEASLQTRNFDNWRNADFGAHTRGWGLNVGRDVTAEQWFLPLLKILRNYGAQDINTGREYRRIAARTFFNLLGDACIFDECIEMAKDFHRIDGWPEGWCSCQKVLKYVDLDKVERQQLERLLRQLKPSDLNAEIRATLLSPDASVLWHENGERSSGHEKFNSDIREIGNRAGSEETQLIELIEDLIKPNSIGMHCFGIGVGETITRVKALFAAAKPFCISSEQFSTTFFTRLLATWSSRATDKELADLLDWMLVDELFGIHYPEFQAWCRPDGGMHRRLARSLEFNLAPPTSFATLWNSTFVNGLHSDHFVSLLANLRKKKMGDSVVAEILAMITYDIEKINVDLLEPIRSFAVELLKTLSLEAYEFSSTNGHNFLHLLNGKFLSDLDQPTHFQIIARLLFLEKNSTGWNGDTCNDFLGFFYRMYPIQTADCVYKWIAKNEYIGTVHPDRIPYDSQPPILEADGDSLIDWMGNDEARFLFLADGCPLSNGKSSNEMAICPLLERLVETWPDKSKAVEVVVRKIMPSGWSGSLSRELRRRMSIAESISDRLDAQAKVLLATRLSEARSYADKEEKKEEIENQLNNERFE